MTRWLWAGLLVGLFATGIQAQPVEVTPLPGVSVTLNNTRIILDSPLVIVNKTVFITLREIVRGLNARTSYLRKDDAFQVQIPSLNTAVVVAPNSTEIWVGGTQGYFSKKTFFKDGQFYVPFEDFFRFINYSVTQEKSGYVIRRGGAVTSARAVGAVASGPIPKDPTVVMVTRPPDPKLDADLPSIPSGQSLAIAFGAKVYPITGKFFMDKDTVYADLESVLIKEGIPVIKRPDYTELVVGRRTFRFFTQTADVRITSGNQVEMRGVGWPLVMRQGTTYFSIKALAAGLNYGLSWDRASRRVLLLNRIQQVAIVRKGGVLKAVISAAHPVVALPPVGLDREGGFSVDLLDVQLGCPSGVIESDDPVVSRMEVQSISETRVRLKIILKPSVGYSSFISLASGGEIVLSNRVTSLTERIEHNEWIVRVSGMGSFVPKVWRIPSPSMALVVDVPNSYSMLPMAIRPQINGPYQMIRTSQFTLEPASTRIVLDMVATGSYTVRTIGHSAFEIVFPYHPVEGLSTPSIKVQTSATRDLRTTSSVGVAMGKPIVPSVAATHSVRREQVIRKTPAHRPLSRKIIVIDPGHGGNDPGAIAANGSYEKSLTIDISNRLKTQLEEAGATVIMCRLHDENPSLQDRCDSANLNNADLLLSIHINSFFHPYATGTETYYYKPSDKPLAFYIHQEMTKTLGFRDNGLKRARLYVLRNTRMPAMLVEPGFITNPMEYEKMAEPETRQKIAKAVTDGTIRYMEKYGAK